MQAMPAPIRRRLIASRLPGCDKMSLGVWGKRGSEQRKRQLLNVIICEAQRAHTTFLCESERNRRLSRANATSAARKRAATSAACSKRTAAAAAPGAATLPREPATERLHARYRRHHQRPSGYTPATNTTTAPPWIGV